MDTRTFSPRELAEIVGVSESSIKRWVDAGLIDVTRTAGGHRRISLREALQFVRTQEMAVQRPERLGLPELEHLPEEARTETLSGDLLYHLLRDGEAARVRGMLTNSLLAGQPLAELFDGPVAEAMHRLGTLWTCEADGIFLEHRATAICFEAVSQLRALLPLPPAGAPVALGGTPAHDIYLLPTLMAATLLQDLGYEAVNLGPQTPDETFLQAVDGCRPALVWLSLTSEMQAGQQAAVVQELVPRLLEREVSVVVGGQQAEALRGAWPAGVHHLESMGELAVLARREET